MTRKDFMRKIANELDYAYAKHGKEQWSRHWFYAILKEEVDETWDCIKKDELPDVLEAEIIQVAAMCLRFLETGDRDLKDKECILKS